jgi:superfamily I DNA/RNA helicase
LQYFHIQKDFIGYYCIIKGKIEKAVFIVFVDSMPFPLEEDEEREVSLFYIGMIRAKQFLYLCLSYSEESKFTKYLEGIQEERATVASKLKSIK